MGDTGLVAGQIGRPDREGIGAGGRCIDRIAVGDGIRKIDPRGRIGRCPFSRATSPRS